MRDTYMKHWKCCKFDRFATFSNMVVGLICDLLLFPALFQRKRIRFLIFVSLVFLS